MSGDHNMYQKSRSYDDDTQYDEAQVQAMIKKAVRDEREECAKVCEALLFMVSTGDEHMDGVLDCIAAIRRRGTHDT